MAPESAESVDFQIVKVRGLANLAASIFGVWGSVILLKSLYNLLWGTPEANLYSALPWQFVTLEQWTRYAGFELCYGVSCVALAWIILGYARFLPKTIRKKREKTRIALWQ